MKWFVAFMCVGFMVLITAPRAIAQDGKGQRFTDVTTGAGLAGKVPGLGVAILDFDQDGRLDVFVTGRAPGQFGKGVVLGDLDTTGGST
jgi:hypothetical protein